jgi:cytochrome c-type biogenesis protein CcmH/NrfG
VRALLKDRPPTEKVPPDVVGFLKRAETLDPDQRFVLWYLGLAAAQDTHLDDARRYWQRLLTKMPPGSDDARQVQAAVDALVKH